MSAVTAQSKEPSNTVHTSDQTTVEKAGDREDSTPKETKGLQEVDKDPELDDTVNRSQGISQALLLARVESSPSSLPISDAEDTSSEPGSEPESTAEAWPEPGPDWSKAYKEWGAAWEIHVYLFAVIFLGFAVNSAYFIGHGLYVGLNQKYLGFTLNTVMLILGFTRAFVLFTDPYLQGNTINNAHVMRVIWSLASPCLTSADCLVILALAETAKISLAPQKMQKFNVIIKIILLHFALVLISDFVVSAFVEAKAMLVFCQVFFIIWGAVLGVGYLALAYKLDQKLFGHKEVKTKRDLLYIRLIYASGINNFILSAMFIYSSAGVFGVYSDVKFVGAWSWWAMQTCFRVSEVLSGILVFTVSAKRKSLKKKPEQQYEKDVDNMADPNHQQSSTLSGTENRKSSMFTHLHSAKVIKAQDGTKDTRKETNMLTDLHEAKIEAYYATEDV